MTAATGIGQIYWGIKWRFKSYSFTLSKKISKKSVKNCKIFKLAFSVYKVEFVFKCNINGRVSRGDCAIPFRQTTFSKQVLSVKGSEIWNNIWAVIRECAAFNTFKTDLKRWLKRNQIYDHSLILICVIFNVVCFYLFVVFCFIVL